MKHVKVKGEYNPKTKTVLVTLLEQSHTLSEFGIPGQVNGMREGRAFEHKDMILYCVARGQSLLICYDYRLDAANPRIFFHLGGSIGDTFTIKLEQWDRLREVVEKYNEWGATQ